MFQHLAGRPEGRDRIGNPFAGDIEGRAVDRLKHGREPSLWVDVGGRCHTKASRQRTGKVGQDIGVKVGGDNRVEAFRRQRHSHRHRIDQHLVPCDIRKLGSDLGSDLVPHHHAMALGVGFCNDCQQLTRPRLRQAERVAHNAADADTGEDRGFGGDLFRQATMGAATMARIFALGILANDHPVQITRPLVLQRRRNAGKNPRRADIRILVKPLADRKAKPPEGDVIRHIRRANRTKENGIMRCQRFQPVLGHHSAMLFVIIGSPVIVREFTGKTAVTRGKRIENSDARGNHLGADTVCRNGCNAMMLHGNILCLAKNNKVSGRQVIHSQGM